MGEAEFPSKDHAHLVQCNLADSFILQIVGSAPGYPHGIIDPIEVSDLLLLFFSWGRE